MLGAVVDLAASGSCFFNAELLVLSQLALSEAHYIRITAPSTVEEYTSSCTVHSLLYNFVVVGVRTRCHTGGVEVMLTEMAGVSILT